MSRETSFPRKRKMTPKVYAKGRRNPNPRDVNHDGLNELIQQLKAMTSVIDQVVQDVSFKSRNCRNFVAYARKCKKYKFSISNRINFQRKVKMSQKASKSPSLLEKEPPKFQCSICSKPYKVEGALKNHMKNHHGVEDVEFDPAASSTTTENFLEKLKEELVRDNKRKRSSETNDGLESFDDEGEENLEEALKAKKAREEKLAQMNQLRDEALGMDDTMAAGGSDTQEIMEDLQKKAGKARKSSDGAGGSGSKPVEVFDEPSQVSSNDNNNSVMLVDDSQEVGNLTKKIEDLKKLLENKESTIMDHQVTISELNDQLDEKDKIIREKRQLIKVKQDEINNMYHDKKVDAAKVLQSPTKLKRQVDQQQGRIKNLEKANKELSEELLVAKKEEPKLLKLKQTANDLITRAENVKQDKDELEGMVAKLKRKIPCPNFATCEYGRKCQYSHTLKYSSYVDKPTPCRYYISGTCDKEAKDCRFSHDQEDMSTKQKMAFLENNVRSSRSNVDEDRPPPSHSRSSKSGSYQAKRRKISETEERRKDSPRSSNDTRNFPTPVSAASRERKRSYGEYSPRSSGNDQGAHARRSSLATPRGRSGSQRRGRGGGSLSKSRQSPRGSRSSSRYGSGWDRKDRRGSQDRDRGDRRW